MRSCRTWIIATAFLSAATASFAEGPRQRGRLPSRTNHPALQLQDQSISLFRTVFDVETAQPVPSVGYRVEYRYLPGHGNTNWQIHSTTYNHSHAQQSVQWILLHLVAEARIVEFTPEPQWQRIATFETQQQAQAHASELAQPGLLTRVRSRRVQQFELQGQPQLQLP